MTASAAISIALWLVVIPPGSGRGRAFIDQNPSSNWAVDAEGKQHTASEYGGKTVPWTNDLVVAIGPAYPYRARGVRHQGTGIFRMSLDLPTGTVRNVDVVRTTGFKSLDNATIGALRQWRFRPNKWKEVSLPVTFDLNGKVPIRARPVPSDLLLN